MFGSDSFQGLGIIELELEQFANELGFNRNITKSHLLPIDIMGVKYFMDVDISIMLLREVEENEENMSMQSGISDASDLSTLGAVFEPGF